ncbi:MAG: DNA (cytosine-5-)-methyltransferase [bacterium]|nr:DNA (cytosine-5-)-methyltransferase [bacterium]
MTGLITITETAQKIGVSVDTIRRWEKKSLIRGQRSNLNYRVFDLAEVKRVHDKFFGKSDTNNYKILKTNKKTGYQVLELFAGAGGTALGFHNAGLGHVMLNDFDSDSTKTLKENKPNWNVIKEDIKKIDFKKFKGKTEIVEGGFPCQAFSYAGKRLGFDDIRGTMFFEFARCIKEVQPKIFMGENVRGLLKHDGGKTLDTIIKILDELGYNVRYKVIKSQYHDVPQKRERLVILGAKKDLKLPILYPKEKNYIVTIKEALANCPESIGQKYTPRKKEIMAYVKPGGYWRDLPIELQKEYMGASFYMGGGKTGMARRLSWDEPSLTLTCNPAQKQTERCHPEETRPLKVREYARIQTFPDSWRFIGSIASQYRQIGNAVPVNLAYHLGRCIIAMLEKKPDFKTMEMANEITQIKLL